jgi:NAD dependent epimerase/dehydratase family enzyme
LVRLIAHIIVTPSLSGAVNGTAPTPERNRAFGQALGHALHRPAFLPLPAAPLRLLGGDFARELLLGGQCVLPRKALASGFVFRHARLDDALKEMVGARAAVTKPASFSMQG